MALCWQLRGKAEAKEPPKDLPSPYDVRGSDTALLTQSVSDF